MKTNNCGDLMELNIFFMYCISLQKKIQGPCRANNILLSPWLTEIATPSLQHVKTT